VNHVDLMHLTGSMPSRNKNSNGYAPVFEIRVFSGVDICIALQVTVRRILVRQPFYSGAYLVDWIEFSISRSKYFIVSSLEELFDTGHTRNLIDILTEISFYRKL
jgi:hypothetical protein